MGRGDLKLSSTDNRIVKMTFDNASFESGVSKSMSTIDKLEEKLQFKKAASGLSSLQSSLNSISMNALATSLSNIENRLSSFGIAGATVVSRITNSVINAAKTLESQTLGQIRTGGWARAQNLANAQFMIEGLKFSWDKVRDAADYAVTDTAYGLDAAAKAASQLAASGVDFEKVITTVNGQGLTQMHKSLRAISGVAAMTNSSYEDISRIFTTVAGNGRLMGDQLLQMSSRGLNAAATLATSLHTTEEEIRNMVSKGQISFQMFSDAMDEAYGEHAKEANKTFTGALSNMKAALSRIGAIFAQPVIDKTNKLFIAITTQIKTIQKALSDVTNKDGSKTLRFASHFAEAWEKGVDALSKLISVVDMSWFQKIADKMDTVAQKASKFFDTFMDSIDAYKNKIHEIPDAMKNVMISAGAAEISNGVFTILDKANDAAEEQTKILSVTKEEAEAARKVINGLYGNGTTRLKKLSAEGFDPKRVQAYVDELLKAGKDTSKMTIQVEEAQGEVAKVIEQARANEHKTLVDRIYSAFSAISKGFATLKNVAAFAKQVIFSVFTAFNNVFKVADGVYPIEKLSDLLLELSKKMILSEDGVKKLTTFFEKMFTGVKRFGSSAFDYAKKIVDLVKNLISSNVLGDLAKKIKEKLDYIKNLFSTSFEGVGKIFEKFKNAKLEITGGKSVSEVIGGLGESLKNFIGSLPKIDASNKVTSIFDIIKRVATFLSESLGGVKIGSLVKFAVVFKFVKAVLDFINNLKKVSDGVSAVAGVPSKISSFFTSVTKVFSNNIPNLLTSISIGYIMQSIAKAILYIAAALFIIGQLDTESLGRAVVVVVIMSLILRYFIGAVEKMVKTMQGGEKKISILGTINTVATIATIGGIFTAVAIAILAIGGSVILVAIAAAIIEKANISVDAFYKVISILALVIAFSVAMIKVLESASATLLDKKNASASSLASGLGAIALMIAAIGLAVLEIAIATKIMSTVSVAGLFYGIAIIGIIFIGIKEMMQSIDQQKPSSILALGVSLLLASVAIGIILFSLAGSISVMMTVISVLSALPSERMEAVSMVFIGILSMVMIFIISCYFMTKDAAKDGTRLLESFAGIAAVLLSLGFMVGKIAVVLTVLSTFDEMQLGVAFAVISGIFGLLILLVYAISKIDTSSMSTTADSMSSGVKSFLVIAIALVLVAAAIKMVANSTSNLAAEGGSAINGLMPLFAVMSTLLIVAVVMSRLGNTSGSAILTGAAAILVMSIGIVIIAKAIASMPKTEGLVSKTASLVVLIAAIAGVLSLLLWLSGKNKGSSESLITIAASFLIISAAVMIFAKAIEALSSINGDIGQAAIILGVFVGVLIVLGVVSAIFPGISAGMMAIGKAFVYAGIGAALIGAGVYLICTGLLKLSPMLPILEAHFTKVFKIISDNIPAALIILAVVIAVTIAIVAFAKTLKPIVTMLATVVTNCVKGVGKTISSAGSGFLNFLSNLSPATKSIIVSLIAAVLSALSDSGPQIMNTIGSLLIKLIDWLSSIVGPIVDKLLDLLISIIDGLTQAVFSHANQLAAAIFNLVYALFDILIAVVGQVLRMILGTALSTAGTALYDKKIAPVLANGQKALKEMADTNMETAKAMDGLTTGGTWDQWVDEFEATTESVNKTKKSVKDFGKEANSLPFNFKIFDPSSLANMTTMTNSISNLGEAMNDLPQAQKDVMVKMGAGVYQDGNFYPIKNAVSNDTEGAMDVLGTFGTDSENYLTDQNGLLGQYGYDGGLTYDDEMANGLIDGQSDITDAANNNVDAQIQVVEDRSDDLRQSGRNSTDATARGINDGYMTVYHESNTLLEGLKKPWGVFSSGDKNATGSGRNLGYLGGNSLLEGFQEAFNEWPDAIKDAFSSTYTVGEEAFTGKNAWDVNSPSKRTMYWGRMIIEGLSNGIYESTPNAINSMTELSNSMMNSFTNPLDYVARVASGELAYDPSIRPILDTSNISTGAYGIRSMFDNQNVTLSGFSGKLAADITELDTTNTQVVSELKALRNDMNVMTEQIAGMQIIMDSGQLVGAIAPGMDDALGRRAIHRGRGN